jgi:hypothetical protein
LAVIKNIIQTQFTSTGANKVTKDTEQINRSQTRLGQASASAGRAFAAQSQGLGGLVAAYAGAAATIFALQQAFSVLAKAAQSEAIIQGTKTLAAEIGQSGPRILKSIKDITDGQVTLTEAAQNANIALSAGFNTKQIEGFTTVALKASRALGRDFTDSLQRITRGVAKLEPELLDELGIFTRIEPAVQKYARQIGVSANSLNEFQRRQAFANAAIEEGLRKFGAIDTTSGSAQKSLEQLRVQVEELGTALAKILVGVLLPVVNFFKNDFGNTLLLFGGLLTLVFSKGSQVVGSFVNDSIKDLTRLSETLADRSKFDPALLTGLTANVKKEIGEGGLKGIRTSPLRGQDVEQAKRFKEALDAQKQGAVQTISELNKVNLAYKEQQKFLRETGKTGSQTYANLSAAILANTAVLEQGDVKAKAFIGTANALRTTVNGVATAFSFLTKALGIIGLAVTAAQLVLQIFGVDAIGFITDQLSKLFTASENFKTGFLGAVTAAAAGSIKLTESLKALGATSKDLEKVPEQIQEIRNSIERTAKDAAPYVGTVRKLLTELFTGQEVEAPSLDYISAATEKIDELNKKIEETSDPAQLDGLRQQLKLVESIAEAYRNYGAEYFTIIGELAAQTGLSAEKVADSLTNNTLGVIQKSSEQFSVFGQQVQKLGDEFSLSGLTEGQRRLVEAGVQSISTINSLNESILAGSINAQQLGANIGGLESQLQVANEAFAAQNAILRDQAALAKMSTEEISALQQQNTELSTSINAILNEIRVFKEIETSLIALEKTYKGITSTFSKEISLLDTAPFQGLIDISGQIVTTQAEQLANQNELINLTLLRNAESAKLIGNEQAINALIERRQLNFEEERELRAKINQEAELYNKTMAASVGRFIDQTIAATNLTQELRKQTQELQQQNAIAGLQNRAQYQQALAQRASLEATASQNRISANITKLQAQQALEQARTSKGGVSAAKQQLDIQLAQLQTAKELARIESSIAQTRAQARVEEARATREAFAEGDLFGIAALAEVFKAEKELFQLQKAEAEANYAKELELIQVERQIAEQNLKASGVSVAAIERQLELELKIFDEQAKLEKAKLEASEADLKRQLDTLETQKSIQRAEANAQKAALEAQVAKIKADNSYLTSLQEINAEFINAYSDVVKQALIATGVNAADIKMAKFTPETKPFTDALAEISKLEGAIAELYGPGGTILSGIENTFELQSGNIQLQIDDLQRQRTELEDINKIRRETIEAQAAAEKAGGQERLAEYEKTLGELKTREAQANADILKAREELAKKEASLILELVKDITSTVSSAITNTRQSRINALLAEEAQLKDVLEVQTASLNEAQNRYSEALQKEISLREKVISATQALVGSQQSYFDSLVSASSGDIRRAGADYLKQLQEQQRAVFELTAASAQRSAAEQSLTSLTQTQGALQEALKNKTAERIEKEEQLAEIQRVLSAITDIANGKLKAFLQTIAGFASLGGGGGIQGLFSMDTLKSVFFEVTGINDLKRSFTQFGNASAGLQNASNNLAKSSTQLASTAETLATSATGAAVGTTAGTSAGTGAPAGPAPATFTSVALSALQGAFIGDFIGNLTGDVSLASTIGGALGGGFAAIFSGAKFVTTVSAGITKVLGGSALAGSAAAFLTPMVFAAIGALIIGALFGKRPKPTADVMGTLTSEGYRVGATTSRDLSAENVKAVESLPEQVFGNLISGLRSAGISFADEVAVQVRYYKGAYEKVALTFKSGFEGLENAGKSAQAAADSLVKQFFQGVTIKRNDAGAVTFRSLVVDALTPNAADLQQAIDTFAEISDITQKTQERFLEGLQFAQQFSSTISQLTAGIPDLANIYSEIDRAAMANAANLLAYYQQQRTEVVKFFGESSDQTERLAVAFRQYALASIGVIETSNGAFQSLEEVSAGLNAGAIAVRNVVARVRAMTSVFTELGMTASQTAEAIRTGINVEIGNLISSSAEALRDAVEAFELGPELKALKDTIEGGAASIRDWSGIIAELNNTPDIEPGRIAEANQALQDAVKLNEYAIQQTITTLTKEQLKAVIAADGYGSAIAETAATQRLAIIREQERTKALQQFAKSSRSFYAGLERINQSISATIGIGAVPLQDLMTAMNDAKFGEAAQSINSYLQNIARGVNIVDNFDSAVSKLNSEFGDNDDKIIEFAQSLEVLQDATIQTIDVIQDLVVAYEDTVSQISDAFTQSKDRVISTIQELGSEIISLTSNISDKTSEILGIYDDTLATVAESGNELYDLRDTAKDAFETAARAVREFEKSNRLSGRSSATLRQEISSVEAQISNLISGDSLDFSGFLQLSELTTKQNALKRELSAVIDVEDEYEKLLGDRTQAIEDLSFVEASIASLTGVLIDTRRKESDIIKKTQDTIVTFNNAQQDLKDITELLAESNFNLNQIRVDEESAVNKVRLALTEYNSDLDLLSSSLEAIGGESGAALRNAFIQAAAGNAEIIFAALEESARNAKIEEAIANASSAFNQLQALATQVSEFFTPVDAAFSDLSDISLNLGDRFRAFNEDLVKYLDIEGLSIFYGEGGVFSAFKESLLTSLKTEGFDILTAPGGPLDTFNVNLGLITGALTTLAESGNMVDVTIKTVTTTFGSFVTAVGTDLDKLTAGYVGLAVVGKNLSETAPENLTLYSEGLGELNAALDASGNISILFETSDALNSLFTSVDVVNSSINNIDFEATAANAKEEISAVANVINSTLEGISLAVSSSGAVSNITEAVNSLNSTIDSIDLGVAASTAIETINQSIASINSTIEEVDLSAATDNMVKVINAAVTLLDSTIKDVDLNVAAEAMINNVDSSIQSIKDTLTGVSLGTETGNAIEAINASVTAINSTLGSVDFSVKTSDAQSAIANVNTTLNDTLAGVSFNTTLNKAAQDISNIPASLNTTLSSYEVQSKLTEATAKLETVKTQLNEKLNSYNFVPALTGATTKIDGIDDALNNSLSALSVSTASQVFKDLVAAVSGTSTTNIEKFADAVLEFSDLTTEINNTNGLATAISSLADNNGSITSLTAKFTALKTEVDKLAGTGGVDALKTTLSTIASDLAASWSRVKLNTEAIKITATTGPLTATVSGGITSTQGDTLIALAKKYPQISGVTYGTPGEFRLAKGGPVTGPGTSTSDSIPARLSDGEYVLRASTVEKLGMRFLNTLNDSGDLDSSIASMGRRGDSAAAHLTPQEVSLLKRLGGSGTRNPATGLMEFFNKDAGAIGRLFAAQEANLLWKTYGPKILQTADAVRSFSGTSRSDGLPELDTLSAVSPFNISKTTSVDDGGNANTNGLFDAAEKSSLLNSAAATMLSLNEMLVARKAPTVAGLRTKYGQQARKKGGFIGTRMFNYQDRNFIDTNIGSGYPGSPIGAWDANFTKNLGYYPNIGYGPFTREVGGQPGLTDFGAELGGYPARFAQAMTGTIDKILGNSSSYKVGDLMTEGTVRAAIDKLNASPAYRNFADFYMLSKTRGAPPAFSSGGLVKGNKDSEISALEPGEFVLRKAAVDRMGLDTAYKLNATGDTGGETNVEVNITNNGAPVNVSTSPQVRRENGKLVVDIILEDIRNNGPIRQQIRSIR